MTVPCHEEFSTHPIRPLLSPRWLLFLIGFIPWVLLCEIVFNATVSSMKIGQQEACQPILDGAFTTIALIVLLAHLWLSRRRAHHVSITQRGVGFCVGSSRKEVSWGQILGVRDQQFSKVLVVNTVYGAFEIGKELSGFDTLRQRLEENSKNFLNGSPTKPPDSATPHLTEESLSEGRDTLNSRHEILESQGP